MEKEEILKAIMGLPKVETNNPISTMNGISVDDLMSAVDRLNKVPTYDELLRENKKQKEIIGKLKRTLINSKEYKLAAAIELNSKQSILIKLLQILEDKEV